MHIYSPLQNRENTEKINFVKLFLRKRNGLRQCGGSGDSRLSGNDNCCYAKKKKYFQSSISVQYVFLPPCQTVSHNLFFFFFLRDSQVEILQQLSVFILLLDVKTWLISAWGNRLIFITHCWTAAQKGKFELPKRPVHSNLFMCLSQKCYDNSPEDIFNISESM